MRVMRMHLPSATISCRTVAAYRVPRRAVIPMHEPRCHGLSIDCRPRHQMTAERSNSKRVTRGVHAPRCVRYDIATSCCATYDLVVSLDVQEK